MGLSVISSKAHEIFLVADVLISDVTHWISKPRALARGWLACGTIVRNIRYLILIKKSQITNINKRVQV